MEVLNIFTKDYEHIGIATREETHRYGYWHEVFHCWVLERINEQWHIYLQLRSKLKKDNPRQFDITAAGHLMSDETVKDGIREMKEELGLQVDFNDLHPLGIIPYKIENASIKDFEFAHVFLYTVENGFAQFKIQEIELDGIYRLPLEQFIQLGNGVLKQVTIEGYEVINKEKIFEQKVITLADMETLPSIYQMPLIAKINSWMEKRDR
ncbi:NUDIX hydrolase [Lysinibacillus sp. 3P01SB]|uniref:NUDIX hydrolase n=1 Tax=Lysinibacillus sp. 3P01SB TaxID=3132284 RepID=UPI0039A75122